MSDITKLADHASSQSDRWLFICALIVLGLFGLLIWRWIVTDRAKISQRLTEVTDRHIAQGEKMTEVVANNTTALRDVSEVLRRCRSRQEN